MNALNSWFNKPLLPNRNRAERRTSPGLAAYHWTGSDPKQESIRDISSTGVYLLTEERWPPGALVSLTLQRYGPPEKSSERRISVQARAVRWGEDGVGMSFVLPSGMDLRLWESPRKSVVDAPEPEEILHEFRMAGALAFLLRICPSATDEVKQLLREGLSNYRVDSAVEIALKAEKLIAPDPNADKLLAPSKLVMRILEDGSWAEYEWIQQLWAGLLATSCTLEGKDESNLTFVDLFSQLTAIHTRIFAGACTRASKVMARPGWITARTHTCTAEEMIQITGSHDLVRIDRDIEHLCNLGLLAKRVKSSFFSLMDETNITPTNLGLNLYARCSGHRGTPEDFYGVPSPDTAVFANEQ